MSDEQQKTKPISVKEFRMWLQGVEEMQADNWVPNSQQWKRIRAKIDQIEGTETYPATYAARPVPYGPAAPTGGEPLPPGMELVFPPRDGSAPAASGSPTPTPSGLNVPTPPSQPAPRATATPSGMPVTLATGSPNVPVKTPDVDTSKGNYNSQFV